MTIEPWDADPSSRDEIIAWIRSRPTPVRDLLIRFPPACEVRALRPLTCPLPGQTGVVVSYTDDGSVSVMAEGNPFRGFCDPDWLKLIGCPNGLTPDVVREILEARAP